MKQCRKCKQLKPLDKFGKDKSRGDGATIYCKPCKIEKERQQRDRGSINEQPPKSTGVPVFDLLIAVFNRAHLDLKSRNDACRTDAILFLNNCQGIIDAALESEITTIRGKRMPQ